MAGSTNQKFFSDSRSVRDLFAYLIVKAGSLYFLLNDNPAENARKKVFVSELSVKQNCGKRENPKPKMK